MNASLHRQLNRRKRRILRRIENRTGVERLETAVIKRYDPAYFNYIRKADPEGLADEADGLLGRTISDFGDVPYQRGVKRTLADVANARLDELRNLSVGRVAPEIVGEDADGKAFKLNDHRGKVIVLTFSGNWCPPCRAMYPRERDLVSRLGGRPFALLSVNTDEEKATLSKSIKSGDVTWRCWWDGRDRSICSKWGIQSFPTIFLLDPKGIIRHKYIGPPEAGELEKAVDILLDTPDGK